MSDTPRTDAQKRGDFVHIRFARELERENAALRELTATLGAPNHVGVPVEQWKALRKDKERLDWLDGRPALRLNKMEWSWLHTNDRYGARDIVDALMQEANQ